MSKMNLFILLTGLSFSCTLQQGKPGTPNKEGNSNGQATIYHTDYNTAAKTIHVFVALCDNKYQGIVPVPQAIGNGQDPDNNLYWGCGYGVRTYFKNSKSWTLLKRYYIDSIKLERLVFKNKKRIII